MTLINNNTSVAEKRRLRVLLVDDDRDDSLIFSKLICHLRNYKIDFTWTSDYDNALDLVRNRDYHIHFVDYLLGRHSGLELVGTTLRDAPEKSFVLVTGHGNEAIAAESIRIGALDYIAKADLTQAELERSIAHCVRAAEDRTRRFRQLELARFDGLTGVYRREAFNDLAALRIRSEAATETLWTLLFLDIDHFKEINDRHGHQHGDKVLRAVADAIGDCLRRADVVCRYGGEEFCILTGGGDRETASALGERIRHTVDDRTEVTVSIGVAQECGPASNLKSMVSKADTMMYRAKEDGRNRVRIWQD